MLSLPEVSGVANGDNGNEIPEEWMSTIKQQSGPQKEQPPVRTMRFEILQLLTTIASVVSGRTFAEVEDIAEDFKWKWKIFAEDICT